MSEQDNTANPEVVSIKIDYETQKMADIFPEGLPSGKIDKKVPGIGATTAELKAERNSIIVVPTRALAYNKYYSEHVENPLYIGSPYNGLTMKPIEDIETYLSSESISPKKIIVVADSLDKTLFNSQKSVLFKHDSFKGYFLMIDEIDTFQSDSAFRDSLEKAIDYYYEHPMDSRCMITATPIKFQLKDDHYRLEQQTALNVENYVAPYLKVIKVSAKQPEHYTVQHLIDFLISKDDKEKIVIALNSLDSINDIISALLKRNDLKLQASRIGIMCSTKNKKRAGEYFFELNEKGTLPDDKSVVFMTSAYFSGIDLNGDFHTLVVSKMYPDYQRLTRRQIVQIIGRKRDSKAKNVLIIPKPGRNDNFDMDIDDYVQSLSSDIENMNKLALCIETFSQKSHFLKINKLSIVKDILNGETLSKVFRTNKQGIMTYSKFKMDALVHRAVQDKLLYTSSPESNLAKNFNIRRDWVIEEDEELKIDFGDNSSEKVSELEVCKKIKEKGYDIPDPNEYAGKTKSILKDLNFMAISLGMGNKKATDIMIKYQGEDKVPRKNLVESAYFYLRKHDRISRYRDLVFDHFEIGKAYDNEAIIQKLDKIHEVIHSSQTLPDNELSHKYFKDLKYFMHSERREAKDNKSIRPYRARLRTIFDVRRNRNGELVIKGTDPYGLKGKQVYNL